MAEREIPERISAIKPDYITVFLRVYSKKGVLFPNGEFVEQFHNYCVDLLQSTPDPCTPPKVIVVDFHGIRVLNYESVKEGFAFPLENFRGERAIHKKGLHSAYVNLSTDYAEFTNPWQVFQSILEEDHVARPVVVARREGQDNYCLIGNARKIAERSECWKKLFKKGGWVNGHEFVNEELKDLPQMEFLNMLHRDGLALRVVHDRIPYFRSIV